MRFKSLALTLAVLAAMAGSSPAQNLMKGANFENKGKGWRFYEIEMPTSVKYEAARGKKCVAQIKGGKGFLHSAAFDVAAGKKYRVTVKARGQGKVSLSMLWWERYDDDGIRMAKPHREGPKAGVQPGGKEKSINAEFTAPKGSKRAYLRIIVEKGAVVVSEVRCATLK